MTTPDQNTPLRWPHRCAVTLAAMALGACGMMQTTTTAPPAFYALESAVTTATAPQPTDTATPSTTAALTLAVSPVRAQSGFDSQRIIYVREPHQLEYFARSEWVDTPARMLGPLVVAAIGQGGGFRAVFLTPGSASGDIRLDTEIVRLQQEFHTRPSHVHFTLRAYLVDEKTRRVLAWRTFDSLAPAASDTPQAGVAAANVAVQTVLAELTQFVVEKHPALPPLPARVR